MFRILHFFFYHGQHIQTPLPNRHDLVARKSCWCSLDALHVHNSIDRRINSLPSRRRSALALAITATIIRILGSNRQIRVSQIVLALHLIADILLDAQVESLVIRVRLNAERPVSRDVLDLRARVPVRRLGGLCFRVPSRAVALDAPAVLGIGQDVEADLAVDSGRGVRGPIGAVSDGPVGDGGQRVWRALLREGGRWWTILLDVVHLRVPLFALRNNV